MSWQIRTTDEYGEETCACYYSLTEAQAAYDDKLIEATDEYLELELLEILQQHTLIKPSSTDVINSTNEEVTL